MKKTCELPNKLSALIRLAIHDLELCEADPRYRIEMSTWHSIGYDSRCRVCLAGAVMAKTCDAPISKNLAPYDINGSEKFYWSMRALDLIRDGDIYEAMHKWRAAYRDSPPAAPRSLTPKSPWVTYAGDRVEFKANVLDIADQLERLGE